MRDCQLTTADCQLRKSPKVKRLLDTCHCFNKFVVNSNIPGMQKTFLFLLVIMTLIITASCTQIQLGDDSNDSKDSITLQKFTNMPLPANKPEIMKEPFGKADLKEVFLFTLSNSSGIKVKITNYGGIITSVLVPDKNGQMGDIVLGYDTLDQYIANSPYFGAMVGRYANRIAKGKFTLNGKNYKLAINNGNNSLHGE